MGLQHEDGQQFGAMPFPAEPNVSYRVLEFGRYVDYHDRTIFDRGRHCMAELRWRSAAYKLRTFFNYTALLVQLFHVDPNLESEFLQRFADVPHDLPVSTVVTAKQNRTAMSETITLKEAAK
jgi:hypothetical protein